MRKQNNVTGTGTGACTIPIRIVPSLFSTRRRDAISHKFNIAAREGSNRLPSGATTGCRRWRALPCADRARYSLGAWSWIRNFFFRFQSRGISLFVPFITFTFIPHTWSKRLLQTNCEPQTRMQAWGGCRCVVNGEGHMRCAKLQVSSTSRTYSNLHFHSTHVVETFGPDEPRTADANANASWGRLPARRQRKGAHALRKIASVTHKHRGRKGTWDIWVFLRSMESWCIMY